MNEEEIIKGCKSGKRKAQNTLVHEYAGVLMSVCLRYTKDKSIAQDALQETFMNVFKYINTYSGKGSLEGWLKRIAVNCSLTILKKFQTHKFTDHVEDSSIHKAEIPDIYSTLGREEILKLLQKLPPSMNIIFNLSIIEGYNHREISELLKISERTSRATLSRARARLIKIMEQENKDESKRLDSVSVWTEKMV